MKTPALASSKSVPPPAALSKFPTKSALDSSQKVPLRPKHVQDESSSQQKAYSRVRVLIISWKDHDHDPVDFQCQLQDVHDYFTTYIGVKECE